MHLLSRFSSSSINLLTLCIWASITLRPLSHISMCTYWKQKKISSLTMAVCPPIPSSHFPNKAFASKTFLPNPSILSYGPEIDSLSMQAFWKSQKPTPSSSPRKAALQPATKRKAQDEPHVSDSADKVVEYDYLTPENWAGQRHYPSGYSHSYSAFSTLDEIAAAPVSKKVKTAASDGTLRIPTVADREAIGVTHENIDSVDRDLGTTSKAWLQKKLERTRNGGKRNHKASFIYAIEKQYSREGVVVSKTLLRERLKRSDTGSLQVEVVSESTYWVWEGLVKEVGRDGGAESWLSSIGR